MLFLELGLCGVTLHVVLVVDNVARFIVSRLLYVGLAIEREKMATLGGVPIRARDQAMSWQVAFRVTCR
jgi:hypothetical protein